MTRIRRFILAMAIALAIEAGIYYLLAAMGASGDLVVTIELVWLCVVGALAPMFAERPEH